MAAHISRRVRRGGRDRTLEISAKGEEAIAYARSVGGKRNTMPPDRSEKQWEAQYYRILKEHGLTKSEVGASSHGLRHAYAQERYEKITGFEAPCKFGSKDEFRANAQEKAHGDWKELDSDARLILKTELGHGPDRDDVVSQYLGSK